MSAFRRHKTVRPVGVIVVGSPDFGRQGKPAFHKTQRAPDRKPAWLQRREEDQRRSRRRVTREFLEQTRPERKAMVELGRLRLGRSRFRG